MLNLHEAENLKIIKGVCEMATKEYAVQMQLNHLEKDIKSVEFDFELLPDGETLTVNDLPELALQFEDYQMRLAVLASNPHVASFKEKLTDLGKIVE